MEGFWSAAGWGVFTVNSVQSFDNGETWTNPSIIYAPLGYNAGAPQVAVSTAGHVYVSFMTNANNSNSNKQWPAGAFACVLKTVNTGANITFPNAPTCYSPPDSYWPAVFAATQQIQFLVQVNGNSYMMDGGID